MECVHTGSVKNIFADKNKDKNKLFFEFSERYSIFDWGEMPDLIPHKGEVLSVMAARFFALMSEPKTWQSLKNKNPKLADLFESPLYLRFCQQGVPHHCLGLDEKKRLVVQAVDVLRPASHKTDKGLEWDYSAFEQRPVNALVPLEVIFRFGVPQGSSLLKRTGNPEYLKTLGLEKAPQTGDLFERPLIEYSTKLEPTDRYLDYKEAQRIAGLNDLEWQELHTQVSLCAIMLKELFSQMQIQLWDGKFEFGFTEDRHFMLVDSIGPDELRLTYEGVQLSKENLRQFYRDSDWAQNIEKAKEMAKTRGEADWKKICQEELHSQPKKLTSSQLEVISQMYQTLLNAVSPGYFPKAPSLSQWLESWQKLSKGERAS